MPKFPNLEVQDKLMPGDVARLLGVTTKTVAAIPDLHPIVLPSGHRRYLKEEVEALLQKRHTSKAVAS